ncbi:MAG TPA: phospholipase D-like domain-containing protein, partial [Rubrivivax sp.]|nr:phospholipase D-like domain-containing protein [Rubrivivax sp.]
MWPLLSLSAFVHAAAVAGGLLVYVMATRIGRQRRHPSVAIAWVLTIAALPYLGVPLFLVFGTRKFARPVRPLHAPHAAHAGAPAAGGAAAAAPRWSLELLRAMDVDAPGVNRVVALHDDGEAALQALLELCRSARSSLALQTFVLREDTVGGAVMQALATAAGRGVQVRLLVDAVGSLWLPRRTEAALAASGVSLCRFMPLVHNPMRGRTNLRNHRKLVVADGRRLWSGGRNLADEYFVDRGAEPAWLDLSFRVDGPLAASALVQFDHDWRLAGGHGAPLAQRPMPSLAPAAAGDAAHAPVPT